MEIKTNAKPAAALSCAARRIYHAWHIRVTTDIGVSLVALILAPVATQVAGRDVISACADSVSVIRFLTKARYIPLFIWSHFYVIFVYVLLRYVNSCRLSFMINILPICVPLMGTGFSEWEGLGSSSKSSCSSSTIYTWSFFTRSNKKLR